MTLILTMLACKVKPPDLVMLPDPVRTSPAEPAGPLTPGELGELVDNFARVHFVTDSDALDGASQDALRANAAILARHPEVRVEVEGHADERGTVDYNLALGQRRGATVVRLLGAYGVPASRLSVVSLGEERPLVPGTGEVAWAENRRAEFRVLTGSSVRGTVAAR